MNDRQPRYWLDRFRDDTLVAGLAAVLIRQIDDTLWSWYLVVVVVLYGLAALLSLIMLIGIMLGYDRE